MDITLRVKNLIKIFGVMACIMPSSVTFADLKLTQDKILGFSLPIECTNNKVISLICSGIKSYNKAEYKLANSFFIAADKITYNSPIKHEILPYRAITTAMLGQHQKALDIMSQARLSTFINSHIIECPTKDYRSPILQQFSQKTIDAVKGRMCNSTPARQYGLKTEADKIDHYEFVSSYNLVARYIPKSLPIALSYDQRLCDGTNLLYGHANEHFVDVLGNTLFEPYRYGNGLDRYVDGLVRYIKGDKIGFLDKCLKEVIPAQYDFAFPFSNGTTKVCNGCTSETIGEHSHMVGGWWGVIDTLGVVIVPIKFSKEELNDQLKVKSSD